MPKKKKPGPVSTVKKTARVKIKPLDSKVKYLILTLFTSLSLLLYFKCISYGYVLDDKIVITDNAYTKQGLAGIDDILFSESFEGYFGEQKNLLQGGRYRPLSIITFAIEYEFLGLNPGFSHLVNILLYGFCAFLAFITLRRLFGEKTWSKRVFLSLSFLAGLLYLVHPIHTEAVANIKGRDELMAFIFSMAALFYGVKYFDHRRIYYLVVMSVTFFLGLLSKENTITFLAIIPFGLWLFRKDSLKASLKIMGILLITIIAYLIMRYQVIGFLLNGNPSTDIMNNPFYGMETTERLATVMYTLLIYLKLNIFPHPLTHDYYPYHIPIMDFRNLWVWLSVCLHVLIAGGVFYFWKRNPKLAFALGFYLAAMSIVSNLFVDVGTFMNERFAFTASLGICVLIVHSLKVIQKKFRREQALLLPVMAAFFILPFAFKTFTRVPAWENQLTLNSAAIKVSKNSARANSFMSTALFEEYKVTQDRDKKQELLNRAQPYMLKAVEIYPDYFNGNLMRAGIAAEQYKFNGDLDALLDEFLEVIKRRPDVSFLTEYLNYLNGRADRDRLIAFYKRAGRTIISQRKNISWAVHYLLMGNNLDPGDEELKALLAEGYTLIGRPDEAAKYR